MNSLRARRRAAITLSIALMLAACAGSGSEGPAAPDRVILVTVDTLRADHVSAFGYPIETTPFFDRLASEGSLFTRAYAHSATTKPSHSSMFTSLYPIQHGVRNNGLVLDAEFDTLAEMMAAAGYTTAAFVSTDAPLGGQVNQGFETWDQHSNDRGEEGSRRLYRSATETIDRAIDWVRQRSAGERFFLWVHVYDPHKPLQPPADAAADMEERVARLGEQAYRDLHLSRGIPADDDVARNDIAAYDAEIRYADGQLNRLFESMGAAGLHDGALWVVTSDHGQGLGAHDWFGHSKQIYNAQLWVPLVFWFGDDRTPRVVQDRVVEHVDLVPTLAEIVGFEPAQLMPTQGQTLVPYLAGERPRDPKWFAFSERSRYVDASPRRQTRGNYEPGGRYTLQDVEYKYMLFTEGEDEFYDLRSDPYELVNLIAEEEYAERRDQLRDVLAQMIASLPTDREAATVSPEDIERLRALGYIQ